MYREEQISHLTIPNKLESLTEISHFLLNNMKKSGIDKNKIAEVQIAVDEAFSNMVQYSQAKKPNGNGAIEITCNKSRENFEIVIKNYADPFNPITADIKPDLESDLEERNAGGLGIHFIKNLMDDLKYEYSELGGYETLTMIKYI